MKIRNHKWLCLLLGAALFAGGCSTGSLGEKQTPGNTKEDAKGTEGAEQEMGRYTEELSEIGTELNRCSSFTRLTDGRLAVFSYEMGPFVSSDEGKTWEPWLTGSYEQDYAIGYHAAAIAPDGSLFAVYTDYGDGQENAETDSQEGAEPDVQEDAEADSQEEWNRPLEAFLISPDGKAQKVEFEGLGDRYMDENVPTECWYSPDGTLYVATDSNILYEADPVSGTLTKILESDQPVEQVSFSEKRLAALTTEGALLYDLEAKEQMESDEVLDQFIREKAEAAGNQIHFTVDAYSVYAQQDGDTIYLICEDGIYAHGFGGGTMEKLMDGTMYAMGDPEHGVYGMLLLPDTAFLVMYGNEIGKLSYDPSLPAVPEKELKVYSLTKDDVMQKTASLFMQRYPEVYVNYEVGMSGTGGQTAEDAIRALNTQIMAGEGPDVLLLDGLPLESYEEKGLLADLSETLETAKKQEPVFENIAEGFRRKDGGIYAIPARFSIPALLGPAEFVKEGGLEVLTDAVEKLRTKKAAGSVMGGITAEGVLKLLALSSAPAWEGEDGQMDEEAVREFLEAAQKIYGLEVSGVSEAEKELFESMSLSNTETGEVEMDTRFLMDVGANQMFLDPDRLALGKLCDEWSMQSMISAQRQTPGSAYGLLPGQQDHVFLPQTVAGISAAAKEKELAGQFLQMMLSKEAAASGGGFSINREAQKAAVSLNEGDEQGIVGAMSMAGEDGTMKTMNLYALNEEEKRWLEETIGSLAVPYIGGSVLEEAVLEAGEALLEGTTDLDGAMEQIRKAVRLEMAE